METNYAVPRCTYVELRNAAGEHIYTITAADAKKFGAPLAVEDFTPLSDEQAKLLKALMRYEHGKLSDEQANLYYSIITNAGGSVTARDSNGGYWSLAGLMEKAQTRVYLTGDGVALIRSLSGAKRAYDISDMELYVLSPFIQVLDNPVVKEDPEPDPEQPKAKNNSLLNKLLLIVAGWALFN